MNLVMASPPAAVATDTEQRIIEGLIVPFGPAGQTSMGRLTFGAGALTWSRADRVKLLREHDQRDPVGVGLSFDEVDATEADRRLVALGRDPLGLPGVWGRYHVPEGDNGDRALAEAKNGLRDGFSVGVQLTDASAEQVRKARGGTVTAAGQVRETSLVSVPAFDDARVGAAARAELVVSTWAGLHPEGVTPVTAATTDTTAPAATDSTPAELVTASAPSAAPTPLGTTTTPDPAPLAAAGAALVTSEPSTYRFSGSSGPSIVRDMVNGHHDPDAAARLRRFNTEITEGNPASVMALAAVYQTDTADISPLFPPNVRRPDLLLRAADTGRPIVSRIPMRITINDATPFLIPGLGEFDGVAEHTEGTAHVAEGTLDLDERTVTPKAYSGAFRMSREAADSSNPALDRIALEAMLQDYRRVTEAAMVTTLAAADASTTLSINTVNELRARILGFGDDTITPDVVFAGRTYVSVLVQDVDNDGRPLLARVGATNSVGTLRPGATGFEIDGVDVVKASSMGAEQAFIVHLGSVMVAESPVQTFRFAEVEGPGVIKLALFAYFAPAVLRAGAVDELTSAAS